MSMQMSCCWLWLSGHDRIQDYMTITGKTEDCWQYSYSYCNWNGAVALASLIEVIQWQCITCGTEWMYYPRLDFAHTATAGHYSFMVWAIQLLGANQSYTTLPSKGIPAVWQFLFHTLPSWAVYQAHLHYSSNTHILVMLTCNNKATWACTAVQSSSKGNMKEELPPVTTWYEYLIWVAHAQVGPPCQTAWYSHTSWTNHMLSLQDLSLSLHYHMSVTHDFYAHFHSIWVIS